MKNKKRKYILLIIIVILFIGVIIIYNNYNNDIYVDKDDNLSNSGLSLMIETKAGSGEYTISTSDEWPTKGYEFNAEKSACENGGTLSWDGENQSVVMTSKSSDKCYAYFDIYIPPTIADFCSSGDTLATCVTNFGDQGSEISSIYIHNSSLTNGAGDNSYRYAGASDQVNNFVCFGSTETLCPTDNLYRIIGVFEDKVKLIKYDYANSNLLGTDGDYKGSVTPNSSYKGSLTSINTYYWNYKNNTSINNGWGSNVWSTSLLNKTNLNTNYLNNIGTTWSNLIEDTIWRVSGHTTYAVAPKAMYTAEITNATKTYGPSNGTSKIGLMYLSDYGFAAAPSAWTSNIGHYDISATELVNWMYMGLYEWTISPWSSRSYSVFLLDRNGYVSYYNASNGSCSSRPVFYLKASALYAGGSGTKDSPITLVV